MESRLLRPIDLERYQTIGNQQNNDNPIVINRFITLRKNYTWYATEFNPHTWMFFWYIKSDYSEWWYFSLYDLENIVLKNWVVIMRDQFYEPKVFSEALLW